MKIPHLIFLLFAIIVFTSCNHYFYAPNMHNVPLLKDQKDTRISIAQSNGGEISSTEIQGAYAVTNKVGVMVNTMFAKNGNKGDSTDKGNGSLIEAGGGYFKPLGNSNFIFESYLGAGGGSIKNIYRNGTSIHTTATRFFVQPAIGYSIPHFQIALSTKFCGVNLSKPSNYSSLDSTQRGNLDYLGSHSFSMLLEPAITIRAGWNNLKLQFQYGRSSNLNNPKLIQGTKNVSLGLYIDLNKSFWEKHPGKK